MPPNDPIATRPAGRVNCNRDAMAGLGGVVVRFLNILVWRLDVHCCLMFNLSPVGQRTAKLTRERPEVGASLGSQKSNSKRKYRAPNPDADNACQLVNTEAMSPVGSPACPYCAKDVGPETGLPFGLVSCGHCGERLWLLTVNSERSFFRYEAAGFVAELFHGLAEEQFLSDQLKMDPLDWVEAIVDFEAALREAS